MIHRRNISAIIERVKLAINSFADKNTIKMIKTSFKGKEEKVTMSPRNTEKETNQAGKQDI